MHPLAETRNLSFITSAGKVLRKEEWTSTFSRVCTCDLMETRRNEATASLNCLLNLLREPLEGEPNVRGVLVLNPKFIDLDRFTIVSIIVYEIGAWEGGIQN